MPRRPASFLKENTLASGLYLPKSHREAREQKEAQMLADEFTKGLPDFRDSRLLEERLKFRDPAMRVVWAQSGPHMNRWVVIRFADDGMPHTVRVIANDDGTYKRPEPGMAETFIDLWSSAGNQILREMEAEQARRDKEAERQEEEAHAEIAERIASLYANKNGIKDRAFISTKGNL